MNHYLIVCCLKNHADIHKHLNKKKNKEISDWLKHHCPDLKVPADSGGMFYNSNDNKPLIIFIGNEKRDWKLFNTLVHETNHVVHYLSKYCGFEDECEFNAYMQEYLFDQIRKIIQ